MANIYELKLYGLTYHKIAKNAATAKKKLQREASKSYKKDIPISHIKLVRYYKG